MSASVSEVISNLASAISSDTTLANLANRFFGKPINIFVGSYDGSELVADNTPFVYVESTADDMPISMTDGSIESLKISVVLAIAPKKEAPKIVNWQSHAESCAGNAKVMPDDRKTIVLTAARYGTDSQYESVVSDLDEASADMSSARSAMDTTINFLKYDAEMSDLDSFNTHIATFVEKKNEALAAYATYRSATVRAAGYARDAGDIAAAAAADQVVIEIEREHAFVVAFGQYLANVVADINDAYAVYEDDPYVHTIQDDRTLYLGAQQMKDVFRRRLEYIFRNATIGMILDELKFMNSDKTHLPMDWVEAQITVKQFPSF